MTERWRAIDGWPDYIISNTGKVWNIRSGRRLTCRPDSRGYPTALLTRDGERRYVGVHRLVLTAFVGPCPEGKQTAHYDGNPANNNLNNLRWSTPRENMDDQRRHGTRVMGSRVTRSKLTEAQVTDIRRLRDAGMTTAQLSSRFGVTQGQVCKILRWDTWRHVS